MNTKYWKKSPLFDMQLGEKLVEGKTAARLIRKSGYNTSNILKKIRFKTWTSLNVKPYDKSAPSCAEEQL
jgi:hypothetical protein